MHVSALICNLVLWLWWSVDMIRSCAKVEFHSSIMKALSCCPFLSLPTLHACHLPLFSPPPPGLWHSKTSFINLNILHLHEAGNRRIHRLWFLNIPCPSRALEGHYPRRTDFFFFIWSGDCFFSELISKGPSLVPLFKTMEECSLICTVRTWWKS